MEYRFLYRHAGPLNNQPKKQRKFDDDDLDDDTLLTQYQNGNYIINKLLLRNSLFS